MREALLLAIAVTAFVAAAFVPGGAVDSAAESAQAAMADDSAVLHVGRREPGPQSATSYEAWAGGPSVLARAGDGHFYAQVAINGMALPFLVDTGASMVALTGEDAMAAGLTWSPADIRPVAQGASGPVYGVAVQLDDVVLGGHEARGVAAIIVPEGLGVSLLGQSFLSTIEPVRIEGDRMVLGE